MHAHSAYSPLARFIAALCALVVALGMIPLAPAMAIEPTAAAHPSVEEMLDASPSVQGEALVMYRADEGSARSRALNAANPLAAAGFSIEESWDFAGAGAATNALSLDEGAPHDAAAKVARVTKPGADTAALLEELQATDGVLAAAPNYVHKSIGAVQPAQPAARSVDNFPAAVFDEALGTDQPVVDGTSVLSVNGTAATTDDPLSALQWALDNEIVSDAGVAAHSDVGLASVYTRAAQGEENIVAVLDSGVDYHNDDLLDAMWANPGNLPGVPGRAGTHGFDFVDGDDEPLPESTSYADSHGTHCAGIVAATSNNGTGISGVSPKTKIMALRANGTSTGGNINDGAILASYDFLLHARLAGQNVVAANNSWGGIISPVTEYAMNQAGRAGVLTVFAADNNNANVGSVDGDHVTYGLSDSAYILSVAATLPLGAYATYTNHNATAVDVAAPGSVVLSTVAEGAQAFLPAVAKLLDDAAGTPGVRSLYYHNMAAFAQGSEASIVLHNGDGSDADQNRVSVTKGIGIDGRAALEIDVEGMSKDEYVVVSWRIANPFKKMSWDQARNARIGALPGIALDGETPNGASEVIAQPFVLADDGTRVMDDAPVYGGTDNISLAAPTFVDEASFNRIANQDSIVVGALLAAWSSAPTGQSASLVVSDFGIGYPSDDQSYNYLSGTSMACPLVAGAAGLLASIYPDDSALELRGRIVGGTKGLHDAASGVYPAYVGNVDGDGRAKQTASNGTLDLGVAAGAAIHPSTWGAHEKVDASSGEAALALEGYALDRTRAFSIDGAAVAPELWTVEADGAQLVVRDSSLLDGGRHTVVVSDGAATHTATLAFPKTDQRLAFERVADLPDPALPDPALSDEVGFDSGLLVAASDRLFCVDSKGRYLYAYDPDGAGGWVRCASPSDAGFGLSYFRADGAVAYADGKLYLTVLHDEKTGDSNNPYELVMGVIAYDIAADAWDGKAHDLTQSSPGPGGAYFASAALAACNGRVYLSIGSAAGRSVIKYDPVAGDKGSIDADIDIDKADPDGVFSTLVSGQTAPLAAIGDELRFVGFVSEEGRYAMTLGTFDGETFGVVEPGAAAPRFGADELDALEGYAGQASAATGDSIVFTGASADGLGDTYAVDAATGVWTPLDVKAPGDGSASVSTACFYRGVYYVVAASTGADGNPTTSLYRLPNEVALTPNDHTARAQAAQGGAATVIYGTVAASQVEHVALGDTVQWNAVPDDGYTFSGWYGKNSSLISKDTSYRQSVTADMTLGARFSATSGPGPAPAPSPLPLPTPDGGAAPTPVSDAEPMPLPPTAPKSLASTGDGARIVLVSAAFLAAVSLACTFVARRRKRG